MTKLRKRGEEVRGFILESVERDGINVIPETMKTFNITRQAVYNHIRNLIKQGVLIHTKYGSYELRPLEEWSGTFAIDVNSQEDVVWRNIIAPRVGRLPDNAIDIWSYGFTEMLNNVIDHSGSKTVQIIIKKTAHTTEIIIFDQGVGIFNKIKRVMNLLDERHAVLELTKGKLTTDPNSHTGEGIFFTSRMFDTFCILSGEVFLSHSYGADEDWILQNQENCDGTWVSMKLKNNTSRTSKEVFDRFRSDDDFGFTKTIVPVRLAQYGNEKLISRSQAKRLLERADRFKMVLFDFNEVEMIGQAFGDEVFRVFPNSHPRIQIIPIRANDTIMQVINRVQAGISEKIS